MRCASPNLRAFWPVGLWLSVAPAASLRLAAQNLHRYGIGGRSVTGALAVRFSEAFWALLLAPLLYCADERRRHFVGNTLLDAGVKSFVRCDLCVLACRRSGLDRAAWWPSETIVVCRRQFGSGRFLADWRWLQRGRRWIPLALVPPVSPPFKTLLVDLLCDFPGARAAVRQGFRMPCTIDAQRPASADTASLACSWSKPFVAILHIRRNFSELRRTHVAIRFAFFFLPRLPPAQNRAQPLLSFHR